ncbi:cytochrome c biogenesis protein ResB [Pigmentiphaga litoralis]|uniref:Cytochrome c biogenesis protein n=1 Tax=Pigmentiphaga litoralis TaxID=516702 RepID=A0A7Y9IZV7_9BURK|nr:cytochrome c biogenesis protein [Pigmentiphaga litoralis]NYE86124.1 cytochrome c biogenesis protein [Pigmentiphaga litoralis]
MNASTPVQRTTGAARYRDDVVELLGSMRFAVSLLSFICVASVVGTVLVQNQPSNNYVNQFGPFWYQVFDTFSLYHVYNAWWFLLIMGFLVVSTSLCLVRNAPKMIKEMRTYREHMRESSFNSFHHRAHVDGAVPVDEAVEASAALLKRRGYKLRLRQDGDATLIAAKTGTGNRLGYIFAHAAIVIICIGGLLDSEMPVRLQVWLGSKAPLHDNMAIADVPPSGRLSIDNPSFRANVLIPEGGQSRNAIVLVGDGAMVQPLPFTIELKKFIVEYYSTGMPRLFASEVEVTDGETGDKFPAKIEVNEPLRYKGVTVYQSSFDDGGSTLSLVGHALRGADNYAFPVEGKVGGTASLVPASAQGGGANTQDLKDLTVEFSGFRPINVENFASQVGTPAPQALREHVASVAGSAAKVGHDKDFRNVGPSVQYKLRDASGQAYEFNNYMLPVDVEGTPVFLNGMRANPEDEFRYVRIPADAKSTMAEFLGLRAALQDPAARELAARRFADSNRLAAGSGGEALTQQLRESAQRALDTFATGGLQAIARFLEGNVPAAEQQRAADVVVKLLGGAMAELRNVARERLGLAPLPRTGPEVEQASAWTQMSVAALSDMFLYPAPVLLSLSSFNHVQASVFQVSRTPGKTAVYLGCLLLVLGVFSMFYIRERRVWLWIKPAPSGGAGSDTRMAMTSQRRTLDFNREYDVLKADLADVLQDRQPAGNPTVQGHDTKGGS